MLKRNPRVSAVTVIFVAVLALASSVFVVRLQQSRQMALSALDALPQSLTSTNNDLGPLARKFAERHPGTSYPPPQVVADFLRAASPKRQLFRRYTFMHTLTRHRDLSVLPLVKAMLQLENQLENPPHLTIIGKKGQRRLSLADNRQLALSRFCIILSLYRKPPEKMS